jgi:AraC-like DNA-binding protein
MIFDVYKIASPLLSRYVQYILFNYSNDIFYSGLVTSYANTNICLGIINGKKLYNRADQVKYTEYKSGINSYISGMYLKPYKFEADGSLDEICIDFTPIGYYRFFKFPLKTYMFNDDILFEAFGKEAKEFFETVFKVSDFQKRGRLIEDYLMARIIPCNTMFLEQCLFNIHRADGEIRLKELSAYLQSSEKKIVRSFLTAFDLTPKDYIRIVKFRKALANLNKNHSKSLTSISYESNYYDQSHFIRDFKFFTERTPKEIKEVLLDIKQNVIVGID